MMSLEVSPQALENLREFRSVYVASADVEPGAIIRATCGDVALTCYVIRECHGFGARAILIRGHTHATKRPD